jgi:hypothetical protein
MLTELEDVVHKNLHFLPEGTNFTWFIFMIKSLVNKGMIAAGQIVQDVRLLRVFLKVWRFEWGLKLELPVASRKPGGISGRAGCFFSLRSPFEELR